jgi:Ni,Fe-hydrogenase III large subunit
MTEKLFPCVKNCQPVSFGEITSFSVTQWRNLIVHEVKNGARLSALFGVPCSEEITGVGNVGLRLIVVLSYDQDGVLGILATDVEGGYQALTSEIPQAHWFERELFEQHGVKPEGHPRLRPIRNPLLPGTFFSVDGEEVHEVAVGPVHAGIIEPGHFRFQCHGERVFHLEVALGYQHRGVERAMIGGPTKRTLGYMETVAGDTSVGHATAYSQVIEALTNTEVTEQAEIVRAIALELERLANHTGDLGALANDVGYLPSASFCGRLRGDFLNLTALLCGSRLGRGLVCPGGVRFGLPVDTTTFFATSLRAALNDVQNAVELLWSRASVLERFEHIGVVSKNACLDLGLVGPAARACGVMRDVRANFSMGAYRGNRLNMVTHPSGDVFARAWMRWLEIQESARFILSCLPVLPTAPLMHERFVESHVGKGIKTGITPKFLAQRLVVSLVEGWRGEICHVAITGKQGRFVKYKVIDPSFHNWAGLELALRNQQISDFPLCNKSFNLSYCGHDL